MTFKRWDVVSVPFPFVEGHEVKRRPALIVSTEDYHRAHRACIAAMITTARNLSDVRPDDVSISDLKSAGLPAPCVVRPARLTVIEDRSDVRRIGSVAMGERRAVQSLLKRWFGT